VIAKVITIPFHLATLADMGILSSGTTPNQKQPKKKEKEKDGTDLLLIEKERKGTLFPPSQMSRRLSL